MIHVTVALILAAVSLGDKPKRPLKKYTINLDLPPEDRFKELVTDHKDYIKIVVDALKHEFSSDAAKHFLSAINVIEEHRREMQGMASAINLTYEDALMANFFYELSDVATGLPSEWKKVFSKSCTGIVAQASDGTIYHGRNQDYPPPFAPLQYDGTFTKGGKVVFEGTSFAGTIGIGGTCMVPGKWSAEINARDSYKQSLQEAIGSASKGDFSFPMLLRSACEHGGDFEDGLKYISETPMIQPGYFTVAGEAPGQGAIVTRNASGTDTDILRLKDGYPSNKPWFLIQTNYDRWKRPPIFDDRRDNGKYSLDQVGPRNLTLDTLWNVMSTTGGPFGPRGVYNEATIHTELVIPARGEYHTYLRHDIIDPPPHIVV